MGFPGGLPGQGLRDADALARHADMNRRGTENAKSRRESSSRSAWTEFAIIIGGIASVATVAGVLVTFLS